MAARRSDGRASPLTRDLATASIGARRLADPHLRLSIRPRRPLRPGRSRIANAARAWALRALTVRSATHSKLWAISGTPGRTPRGGYGSPTRRRHATSQVTSPRRAPRRGQQLLVPPTGEGLDVCSLTSTGRLDPKRRTQSRTHLVLTLVHPEPTLSVGGLKAMVAYRALFSRPPCSMVEQGSELSGTSSRDLMIALPPAPAPGSLAVSDDSSTLPTT